MSALTAEEPEPVRRGREASPLNRVGLRGFILLGDSRETAKGQAGHELATKPDRVGHSTEALSSPQTIAS